MRLAVIGTGYVGLVSGACFASHGNDVACLDIDEKKISLLNAGKIPIFEPGLEELVKANSAAGRLVFTTSYAEAIPTARVIFLAVGTPSDEKGRANLDYLFAAVKSLAPYLAPDAVVVTKSTVPVGTNARVAAELKKLTGRDCHVASNPEFLKEGVAINDFMFPDRVVIGARCPEASEPLEQLYATFLRNEHPLLVMSPESAELTKYVANAFLATKISFINEMANICQQAGGDINEVRRGIGHDRRIGFDFLFPGVGFGGSCFPKDVREMAGTADDLGVRPQLLSAVNAVNEKQKLILLDQIVGHYGSRLKGATIAIWGLAFKARTDDVREAPSLVLLERLLQLGAKLRVFDPAAMENVERIYGNKLEYAAKPFDAVRGAQGLAIMTEWNEFRSPDFPTLRAAMAEPTVFDGRNLWDPKTLKKAGFIYHSIGRPAVTK